MDLINSPFKTSPEEEARLKEQAKNFPVTKLPYMGPRRTRKTSPIFGKRRLRAASPETKIAFSDLERMQVYNRSDNAEQWVPEFANNDHDLQRVLAESAKAYVKWMGSGVEVNYETLDELKVIVAEAFKRVAEKHVGQAPKRRLERTENGMVETILPCDAHYANHQTHIITIEKAGGYLERDAAVAYQTWRLRRNSTMVGEELGLSPSFVRHLLSGLCATARKLGFDATPPRGDHTRGKQRNYRPNPATAKLPMPEELVEVALASGKSFEQLAEQYGVKHPKHVAWNYARGKQIVIEKMRNEGRTWEEINARFKNEPAPLVKKDRKQPEAACASAVA